MALAVILMGDWILQLRPACLRACRMQYMFLHAIHFLCYHQHLFFVVIISTHIPDHRRPVDIGEPGVRPDIAAAAAEITEAAREVLREKL